MAGPVPAIPIIDAPYPPDRDRRDKPGDDDPSAMPVLEELRKWMVRNILGYDGLIRSNRDMPPKGAGGPASKLAHPHR